MRVDDLNNSICIHTTHYAVVKRVNKTSECSPGPACDTPSPKEILMKCISNYTSSQSNYDDMGGAGDRSMVSKPNLLLYDFVSITLSQCPTNISFPGILKPEVI